MYIKPITDTILVKTGEVMNQTLGVSGGGTQQLGPGVIGHAPERRDFIE